MGKAKSDLSQYVEDCGYQEDVNKMDTIENR
jgi:hypothetical protein